MKLFKKRFLLLVLLISVACRSQGPARCDQDLKIEGNWKLTKINNPKDFIKYYKYQELYIDSNTINTVTEFGLISVEKYQIFKIDSIYIDDVLAKISLKVKSDTLFFLKGEDTIQYSRIKKGLKPQSYLERKEDLEFWEDFYFRQERFLKFLKH